MPNQYKQAAEEILALADIKINGDRPWDIQVHNEDFFQRILSGGSLALGESYMDGWWDSQALDQFFHKVLSADLDKQVRNLKKLIWHAARAKLINLQKGKRAYEIGEAHYDVGNDLYQLMLDKRMAYSCGYWKDADNLDAAQEAKLDLICRKLYLKPGMKVLDIGGGWCSFAGYAAEKYGVQVTAITVSKEQAKLGQEKCQGLPVEVRYQDYRDLNEKFDRVLSIGMFEHVGDKNYRTYFEVVNKNLKDDGLQLLHTIGGLKSVHTTEPWIGKYIFPNSMLPSMAQICKAFEGLGVIEDWHNFGKYYDTTLMAWYNNFTTRWDEIKDKYDERFKRMWIYYLLSCAGSFRARKNQLWQIVMSKDGVPQGYQSIR